MDLSALPLAPASASAPLREGRDGNVDVLRGLAALGVALYHFSRSDYLGTGVVATALHHGYLGVHAFFVVSGFVIPVALGRRAARAQTSFELKLVPGFLVGRWIRLYPAFAASALLSVALWCGSALMPGFRGGPPNFSTGQIAANATLSCDLVNLAWINPVFWTLAIEAQYYLLIALCFPLLVSTHRWLRLFTLLTWIVLPMLIRTHGTLFPFAATFALGLILYARSTDLLSTTEVVVLAAAALVVNAAQGDYAIAAASGFSFVFLKILPPLKSRWLLWLGAVSYSLYLVHVPVGGRVINLSEHFALPFSTRLLAVFAALAVSLAAAALFYRYIEAPSHAASRRWTRR